MNHHWKADISYLSLLFLLNPLLYTFHQGVSGIFPDSGGYIVMGTQLLTEGMLYIPGWGHVDEGLILPPLYPLLIGIGRLFLNDGLLVSQYISQGCMILSIIPLFFYAKRLANREIALIALFIVQLNYYYFYYGMVALTEAVFVLTISIGLWLTQCYLTQQPSQKLTIFLLGITSALIFFSRQVGLTFISVVISIIIIRMIIEKSYRTSLSKLAFLIIGFMLLVVPYAITLSIQTGQFIFTQHFRLGNYVITAPTALLPGIHQETDDSYESIYVARRELSQLLPDSSEMYSKVVITNQTSSTLFEKTWEKFRHPQVLVNNLQENLQHLIRTIGIPLSVIFLLTIISATLSKKESFFLRNLLPIFIMSYIMILSLFTGLIERYIEILFIFVLIHIVIEIHFVANRLMATHVTQKMRLLAILLIFSLILWLTPRLFTAIRITPKIAEHELPFKECASFVKNREAIFSFHPADSYLLGGTFRAFPNDSLDKMVKYAKNTKVRWFVLTKSLSEVEQRDYYLYSPWLRSNDLEKDSAGHVKKRCYSQDENVVLYEIL